MKWRTKAIVQRTCSALPASESIYWLIQRTFGSLRQSPDPTKVLEACAELVGELNTRGYKVSGARVMEVGSGRRLDMPIGFYLAGAASVVTVDLHRYLRPELVMACVAAIKRDADPFRTMFLSVASPSDIDQRIEELCAARNLADLLERTNIEYLAPADAQKTGFGASSVDIQFSYTVFEHIPEDALVGVLREAKRILKPSGVALHHIDVSDHFAHDDPSISFVNFLQYSDQEWAGIAGNQFGYHNRLRGQDYIEIYREAGHNILSWNAMVDQRSLVTLQEGLALDRRFANVSPEALAVNVVRILSR
jgi:SAM-dependent methyltransferase